MIIIVVVQKDGTVAVGVFVGVLVNVAVGEGVKVAVGVWVGVFENTDVAVGVEVCEAVAVAVVVDVGDGVAEAVEVEVVVRGTLDGATPVELAAGVAEGAMEVDVGLGFGVDEGDDGKYTNVFVGFAKAVFVARAVVAAEGAVWVVTGVLEVDVVKDMLTVVGNGVAVKNDAPGVRKSLIQAGFVSMAASTGSMNPSGLRVRKSWFGSILDATLVSSSHSGVKRNAQPPASRIHRSPNRRMSAMTAQSRFSFSVALMGKSIERQPQMDRGTRTQLFIVSGALDPDPSVMGVDDTARDGQPQSWPTPFEFGLAR